MATKDTTVKVPETHIDPVNDLRDTVVVADAMVASREVRERLLPGTDKFSLTPNKLAGATTEHSETVGALLWNKRLGYHTNELVFQWVGDSNRPQHNQVDRASEIDSQHDGALVVDKRGNYIKCQDLLLAAYPIQHKERYLQMDEEKRIQDETARKRTSVEGVLNPQDIQHMDKEEAMELRERMLEAHDRFHSPTMGRSLKEVYRSKGATDAERLIQIKMDEIIARRSGARKSDAENFRLQAEAEVAYAAERAASPNRRATRPLWTIKAEFARTREQKVQDARESGGRRTRIVYPGA